MTSTTFLYVVVPLTCLFACATAIAIWAGHAATDLEPDDSRGYSDSENSVLAGIGARDQRDEWTPADERAAFHEYARRSR